MIETLLEKYLTGFKQYKHIVDIYENPTKKELSQFGDSYRFIADLTNKVFYVWDAKVAIHAQSWAVIKKEKNDSRVLYKDTSILSGTVTPKNVNLYGAEKMHSSLRKVIKESDWSFIYPFLSQKHVDLFNKELTYL